MPTDSSKKLPMRGVRGQKSGILMDCPLEQKIATKLKNVISVKIIILYVPQSFDRQDFSPIFCQKLFSCPIFNVIKQTKNFNGLTKNWD